MNKPSEQPRRAVAYIRESTEEQGRGYSPTGSARPSPATPPITGSPSARSTWTSRPAAPLTSAPGSSA
jgi:hypothetical protein